MLMFKKYCSHRTCQTQRRQWLNRSVLIALWNKKDKHTKKTNLLERMAAIDVFLAKVGCNEGTITVQAEEFLRHRFSLGRIRTDQTLHL